MRTRAAWTITVLLGVLVVVVAVAAAAVVTSASDGSWDQPADAVIALAGEHERFVVAEEIADSGDATLVLSWVPGAHPRREARCEQGSVRCFVPDPVSTAGEARAIGELSVEHGWERIVVVTSRYHVGRARLLVRQCVDSAQVHVVSATDGFPVADVVQELGGVLAGVTVRRAC